MLRSIAVPFLGALSLVTLGACSSSNAPAAAGCSAEFSGNTNDSATMPADCASLTVPADAGTGSGYVLGLQASSTQIAQLSIAIDLGATPTTGSLTSDTVANWSAVGLSGGTSSCAFAAGSDTSQKGTFALTLTTVDLAAGYAHGTLAVQMYVHALSGDCGAGDIENADVHILRGPDGARLQPK